MADNQTEFWRRVLNPPDPSGVNSLVEFDQSGMPPVGALKFPIGTTAQRPNPGVDGYMRYNTTLTDFEFFNGSWQVVSGIAGISLSELEDVDADTKIFVENSTGADDDIIAMILGDPFGLYDESLNALTFSVAGFSIAALDANSGNTAGVALSLSAGDGNLAGVGADLTLAAGTGGATGDGGDITIDAGAGGATSGAGGSIALTAGTPPISGAAGTVSITAGGGGSGMPGGDMTLTAGNGNIASGGDIFINAGTVSSGTASGGDISLTAGAGVAEIGGSITLTAGTASEANGGDVTIVGGAGTAGGDGGDVFINSGAGSTEGEIQLQIDGTEAMTVEVDGTLSVPSLTAGGAAYETQVTDDDDIPNKRYVDDEVASVSATLAFSGTYTGTGGPGQVVALGAFVPTGIHIVTTLFGAPPAGVESSVLVTAVGAGGINGAPGGITPPEATIAGPTLVLAAGSTVDLGGVVYSFVAWA